MSYCPECGEQIAKEDVFCPYCGISITPVVSVDDSSMSETIVGMPPVVINKDTLDATNAKSEGAIPTAEKVSEPLIETPKEPEISEKAVGFSAGDTSENWTMKTDSVEIPAEIINEKQVIPVPLPNVFKDFEPESPMEPISPEIKTEESEIPTFEQKTVSEPIAEINEFENIAEAPIPAIIQTPNIEFNVEAQIPELQTTSVEDENFVPEPLDNSNEVSADIDENAVVSDVKDETDLNDAAFQNQTEESVNEVKVAESFGPEIPLPIDEPIETFEPKIETSIDDEVVPSIDDFGFSSPEVSTNIVDETAVADVSQPIFEESEKVGFEQPKDLVEDSKFEPQILGDEPVSISKAATEEVKFDEEVIPPIADILAEPENVAEIEEQSQPQTFESSIEMPDLPLVLENQDDQTKFDSVRIIQKDEIEESEIPPVIKAESSVAEPDDASKEGRPFTTPNIGNTDTDGRKSAKLKPLDEGVILNGRYEIVRKIGGGGMGAVYLANDRNLGGVLRAVKEMVQSYIESDQQDKAISDFKRESLLLTSLDHPAIPTIYDYFFDEKEARFYLVMKYISGGDLAGRLRSAPEGRIDEKSVTEWAIQIADVLEYLHNHEPPIVYRDLKPANVMIDGNTGRVMLIDFGIARWVNKEEKGVTAVGTMGYAPPELFSGNVEARSDIYSLGSTMFHLLTGADPQSNPLLIFDFQKNPRPRQINSQLSDQIEQILMRSVEYNSELRFASAAQLGNELKEHLNNLKMGKVTFGVKSAPSSPTFSEQSVFCGFCGKQIVATDVFCAFCGAQQPLAQQSFSQPSVAVQPLTAKLMIMGTGELEPSSFKLEKHENLLGRRDPMSNIFPEVDLSKYDPQTKISRRHARIWREGNSFLVEDLGSSNGTTLLPALSDSVRLLPHQPHNLTSGDKIRLGDTTLHFTIG